MPGIKFLGSKKIPWYSIGTIAQATANGDATLTVSERHFQFVNPITNALCVLIPPAISAIKARFLIVTDGHTADIEIWQGKLKRDPSRHSDENCDLRRMATLDVVTGKQNVYGTLKHFADTINISNDRTEDGIDGASDGSGADAQQMAVIHWDLKGDNLVVFHGFGTFQGACEIEITGYS